jgi:hypothetical protein
MRIERASHHWNRIKKLPMRQFQHMADRGKPIGQGIANPSPEVDQCIQMPPGTAVYYHPRNRHAQIGCGLDQMLSLSVV